MAETTKRDEQRLRIRELENRIVHYEQLQETWRATEAKLKKTESALRRRNEYLEALHTASLGLIKRLDADELLEVIMLRAGELVDAKNGFVFQRESNQRESFFLHCTPLRK